MSETPSQSPASNPQESALDIKKQAIENALYGARDLRELYQLLGTFVAYQAADNARAAKIWQIDTTLAGEQGKIRVMIDAVNGHSAIPADPQTLDEVISHFPMTAHGEITEEYGLRARAFELLLQLKVELDGVDIPT